MNFKTAWVIPTLNRPKDIERLFNSYLKQTVKPDKVIIIDGSKNDETKKVCEKFQARIENLIYEYTTKLGSVTQRLLALKYLKDIDYALFLDDDFELNDNAFEILLEKIKTLPPKTCLELNFKTISYGSEIQKLGSSKFFNFFKKIFFLPHESTEKKVLPSGGNTWLNEYELILTDELKEVGWLSGCCMFLPVKPLLEKPNYYFNEDLQRFSGYALGEDVYLSVQLAKEGYKFYRVMNAWGIHHKTPSARPDLEKLMAAKVYNLRQIYKVKNKNNLDFLFYFLSIIGNFLLALFTSLLTKSSGSIKGFFKGLN
ncbi:glycosyltransferase family 2 protein [Carboxydothermus hydrogenoformans]|uniref:Glycosyltransferase, group 2 family n=1 Tax=Carboxydothermus hydrogenoformans (strain ATCC BAA-161 / DSM 6008 / Z-2901) TaxID=246194 RepID=Q3AD82_CARHZ|nr:glycosyltransferase [Carboxydothermus hydrogenoformans]ABB13902.1 glycosyltransferase, group 2 family [Carboxydothermus hydrogenoformans Z-2901]